jgi:hypothetical protein
MLDGHVDVASHELVKGWAFNQSTPDETVEVIIRVDGRQVARVRAGDLREDLRKIGLYGNGCHGFLYRFPQPLDEEWGWRVSVHFAESDAPLRAGEHTLTAKKDAASVERVHLAKPEHLSPLLITSFGRSGSTLLMKLLIDHPNISVADTYPFEMRPVSYFANIFRVITAPQRTPLPEKTDTFDVLLDQIGGNPFYHPEYQHVFAQKSDLQSFFGDHVPNILKNGIMNIADDFYSTVKKKNKTDDLYYFAEKCDISRRSRTAMKNLYSDCKEIILVRDLRDAFCSHRKFFKQDPNADVMGHIANMGHLIYIEKEKKPPNTIFLRYEDLIVARNETMRSVGEFLGVPSFWFQESSGEQEMQTKHGTSKSAEASIGRWEADLTLAEQAACNDKFSRYQKAFGYI